MWTSVGHRQVAIDWGVVVFLFRTVPVRYQHLYNIVNWWLEKNVESYSDEEALQVIGAKVDGLWKII